jgi:UPF0755 protein
MRFKKPIFIVLMIGLLVVLIGGFYAYRVIFSPNTAFEEEEKFIHIPTGAAYEEVRNLLAGSLKNLDYFDWVAQRKGYVNYVKPGRYKIKKGMSNNQIISAIRSKNYPIQVTFNNQERLENLAGRIAEQIEADSISLLQVMLDIDFLSEKGFTTETALAMYIPNTYELYWNTTAKAFTERMAQEYKRFWNEQRLKKAADLGLTPLEVINLAAIVQKETTVVSERPRVAGVYLNRLRRNIHLQADPTVIYAIKKQSGDFNLQIKRVLYSDLETDSPYNTYKYPGIPPGPIAMPDVSSIDAVLSYEKHDYLFFVADIEKPGHHIFSKTLAQHNIHAAKYHRWVAQQGYRRK